jgi:hypothetical protein
MPFVGFSRDPHEGIGSTGADSTKGDFAPAGVSAAAVRGFDKIRLSDYRRTPDHPFPIRFLAANKWHAFAGYDAAQLCADRSLAVFNMATSAWLDPTPIPGTIFAPWTSELTE